MIRNYQTPFSTFTLDEDGKVGLGIDEVFDILPIYGSLEPGQSVKTNITFYGHPFIKAECKGMRFFIILVLLSIT